MKRRWVGAAVLAGCLGLAPAARAQSGPLPEPIPFCPPPAAPCGTPVAPGPLSTATAPPGPCADLSLPNDGSGAFPCQCTEPEEACYFSVGAEMLQRQNLATGGVIAVLDPSGSRIDTGIPPPANSTPIQSLSDIDPHYNAGPRATIGYLFNGNQAVEVGGFYIFQNNPTAAVANPGRVDLPFFNPPLGFEGDNGLWLQADRTTTTFSSVLWTLEANYRYTDAAVTGAELIAGVRYLDLDERLSNFTDDDGISFPLVTGRPDPTREALYQVRTQNRLIAPQLGFEWQKELFKWLDLGVSAKGAWGADFVTLDRSLARGDGFVGFVGNRSETQFAQMYQVNAFVDFNILERLKLRMGYDMVWFLNMANASDQIDFNLQDANSILNRNGSIFFQGPMAELQFLF